MKDGDDRRIDQALALADLRVLLMCLYQLTGQPRWLEEPFTPARDVRLVADPGAGLTPEARDEILGAARAVLRQRPEPAVPVPDEVTMQHMMSVCLGERVPPEYAPMMSSEMGFTSVHPTWTRRPAPDALPRVLITGAGISGIALGAELSRLGFGYTIVEKNDGIGGTWWENVYPGAGVDTPNHAYSFSHGKRFHWSRFFALRDEIQDYLERCTDDFDVRRHVLFGTTVEAATWSETDAVWGVRVRAADGTTRTLEAEHLVTAVGVLNTPKTPDLPGRDSYRGRQFHSSRWPDDVDVNGLDVAVVGTGATAMQLAPAVADAARSVTIYQRSPQWVRPVEGYQDRMPEGADFLMENLPFYYEWFRFAMFWRYGDGLLKTLRKDPDWPHPERSVNARNDLHREELAAHIDEQLADRPDLVDKCLPTYPPFGKRILIDNGWYRTVTRPDVELVDTPISALDEDSIVTTDGTHRRADVVVWATGFDVTRLAAALNVTGRDGTTLQEAWSDENPTAYLGITVPGFPNFYCLLGPNSALGHGGSVVFQSECQARYVAACLVASVEQDFDTIEVRQEVHDAYVESVDAEHERLIWTHQGMSNWYRNRRGRVIAIMPWRLVDFWHLTRTPDLADYHLGRRPAAHT